MNQILIVEKMNHYANGSTASRIITCQNVEEYIPVRKTETLSLESKPWTDGSKYGVMFGQNYLQGSVSSQSNLQIHLRKKINLFIR